MLITNLFLGFLFICGLAMIILLLRSFYNQNLVEESSIRRASTDTDSHGMDDFICMMCTDGSTIVGYKGNLVRGGWPAKKTEGEEIREGSDAGCE